MNPRALIIILSVGVLITTVAMVGRQRQQLGELRSQAQELQTRAAALTTEAPGEAETSVAPPTQAGPSLELLRLRSQVGQLERRKRELAGVTEEAKRLQAQLASEATNGTRGVPLPAGYIRRAEAKKLGFGSPEDALQSFLWAVEHRDLPTVLQFFGPELAKRMATEVERRGSTEDFFQDAGGLPGLVITDRGRGDDGTIELTVQFIPNDPEAKEQMRFKQFDGQWRLISGF